MAIGQLNRIVGHLRRAALLHESGGMTDGQLLDYFLVRRDESAFAALVRRHGPMVLGVCQRVLDSRHDAEDAFQATFLVLVRKGASILPRDRVGNWLYGVAYRTALKARTAAARRRRAEKQAAIALGQAAHRVDASGDLRALLDEELHRLPDKYRAPLVLCFLQGKPRKDAAQLLGWSEGTLSGRLARAKSMLACRLTRHGLALSGGALPLLSVPPTLMAATVNAGLLVTAGPTAAGVISAQVLTLTQEVVQTMLLTKIKAIVGVLLLVAGIGFGTVTFARQGLANDEGAPATSRAPGEAQYANAPPEKAKKEAPYVIEPPDVLRVEYAIVSATAKEINGERLVRPDGTIGLGSLGSFYVVGRTVDQARADIAHHLSSRFQEFDPKALSVKVVAHNSRVYYVITSEGGAEQVVRLPITGNETVLDAVSQVKGLLAGISKKRIWVVRTPRENGTPTQILPVDWNAITQDGATKTNYQLLPGDRVYVASGKQFQVNVRVWQGDPLGSQEAGTRKVLSSPRLRILENEPFSIVVGGEVAVPDGPEKVQFVRVGRTIEGKSASAKDGRIHLDLTLTKTTAGERSGDRIRFHTESTRTIGTFKLGEVARLWWGKNTGDQQVWAELLVEEVKP
jgi:polysaccharide export outer membrane protein